MLQFLKKLLKTSQVNSSSVEEEASTPRSQAAEMQNVQPPSHHPEPDYPVPFGYKIQWLAIQADSVQKVIEELGVTHLRRSNWEDGIQRAYEDHIFITPLVKGGVLVVGNAMPSAGGVGHINEIKPIMERLSHVFEEVHYYGSHRTVDYYVWAKASRGRILRAFGVEGDVFWDEGAVTQEERALGFRFEDREAAVYDDMWLPNEEDVLAIAKRWSIDPQMGYNDLVPGLGYIGKIKSE